MEHHGERITKPSEIKQLFESDQKDRQDFSLDPTKGKEIRLRDEQRLKKAKEIIASEEINNPNDLHMLAFLFQHGDTKEDFQQALDLSNKAVENGLPPQYSLIPQATDRLMIQDQKERGVSQHELRQKYGTQVRFDDKGTPYKPPLDGTATKEEFEKFGIK